MPACNARRLELLMPSKKNLHDYEKLPYRPCAGLCVINRQGHVFVGRRSDAPEHIDRDHIWQMPQGGIDEGEEPYPAALRELREEKIGRAHV